MSATTQAAAIADAPAAPVLPYRVGHGFDLHRLAEGYKLVIGGVEIPHIKGCEAHSDGDVLLHTVTDAILGALSLPDIGQLFPDNDPTWKGASSDIFVKEAVKKMKEAGYTVGNLDATIIAQKPKLSPHKENIRANLCKLLEAHPSVVNIKAKTHEKVDSIEDSTKAVATAVTPAATNKPVKKNKVVEAAPEADVQNGIDDLDVATGKCKDLYSASSCKDVTPGEGAVAECISELLSAADAGEPGAELVPEDCQEEVYQFIIIRGKNINANIPLARACKADADKLCGSSYFIGGTADGQVTQCLREQADKLSKACAKEIFKVQKAIAVDYRADPALTEACRPDVERLCKGLKDGGGRIISCLRDHQAELNYECAPQVVRQEAEADGDIRLNINLYQKCLGDKKRFCAEVAPGQAAARSCLIGHRNDKGFTAQCRVELEKMIQARVQDFRVDTRLRKVCKSALDACAADGFDEDEMNLPNCLQDAVMFIPNGPCKERLHEYQALAAQDIRFNVPLAEACSVDRQTHCANVPPGSARVIRCLQSKRENLSSLCRAQLFDEEVNFSENIDFQYPMKQACLKEIDKFCSNVPHGNARVIRCLQDSKNQKEFGKACRKEVADYEHKSSQDYRLNFRLRNACTEDIKELCRDACPEASRACGGKVLRCLTLKREEIKSDSCRKEVYYYEKMEVQDFHNDVILAAQCQGDVEQFCKLVPPGEGRVHACLRQHRSQLSDGCRQEESILEQQEAEHIELRPNLLKACADERQAFCKNVQPGSARIFRCLAQKLADPDFGAKCRTEVISKLLRRQANWKLDPTLRKACHADVAELCKAEDKAAREKGEVYHCLVRNYYDLDPGCEKELGRAVHMAFFIYSPNAILTHPCDTDIQEVCLRQRPNMYTEPGAIGTCLAEALEQLQAAESPTSRKFARDAQAPPQLSKECRMLADVAEPPNMKRAFETTLSAALFESQLSALGSKTGLSMLNRDSQGRAQSVTLTGGIAVAGIAAMVVLVVAGGTYAWKQYSGVPDATTVVLKSRHRYNRIGTIG
eukprot:gene12795-12923_t